jgi:hypothetical protein
MSDVRQSKIKGFPIHFVRKEGLNDIVVDPVAELLEEGPFNILNRDLLVKTLCISLLSTSS